jgi:hypothetical protein
MKSLKALKINDKNVKSYYRKIQSLLKLDRFEEARQVAQQKFLENNNILINTIRI